MISWVYDLYLCGRVFGQSHICSSIISCLIIGAIFGSEDRALFVPTNIDPTNIIFTLIKILPGIFNHYCTHSLHHKEPETLVSNKTPLPITSRDIPSHFSQYWATRWQAYCSPDNCPTNSASEDNWQLSDNTMKEVDATPCQPLQRSTAPSNSMPYHIAIGEVRIRRQKNHLGWM